MGWQKDIGWLRVVNIRSNHDILQISISGENNMPLQLLHIFLIPFYKNYLMEHCFEISAQLLSVWSLDKIFVVLVGGLSALIHTVSRYLALNSTNFVNFANEQKLRMKSL